MQRYHRLVGTLILTMTSLGPAADPKADAERLQKELGSATPERALEFIRGQLPSEEAKKRVAALIEQMGSSMFKQRQDATRKVIEIGPVALPQLRQAANHGDKEIAGRARRCISEIQSGARYDLPMVAVRHLAALKHDNAVEVLLAYLPLAGDDASRSEIMQALATLGVSGTTVHPALKKALDDPQQRPAAVQMLLKANDAGVRKQLRTYLTDKDPGVRFHVAMHFLAAGDRDTIPVLIDLVAEAPTVPMWQQAEEALYSLAGELAPAVEVKTGSLDDRKDAATVWKAWWKAKGDQVLLGQKDDHPTDSCIVSETGRTNRVFEWRPDGKPRFEITDLVGPVDARLLPGRRVLVAEQNGQRVTERDFRGKILWEKAIEDGPVSVQRLPSGNTFVATMRSVMEISRDGQVQYTHSVDDDTSISDANRLTDGRIAIITTESKLLIWAANGKEIKNIAVDSQGALEALPNGHVLVSQVGTGRVTEFDDKGVKLFDTKLQGAWMGTRLPDGSTLIASKTGRKMTKVDKDGKTVWEKEIDANPHAIHWK